MLHRLVLQLGGLFALAVLISSCGSSGSSQTAFGQYFTSMTNSMEAASLLTSTSTRNSSSRALAEWDTTAYMNDPRCSGGATDPHCLSGAITLKDYMGVMIDESAVRDNGSAISIFGRIKNALMIGCAVMNVIADGSGSYPADGTHALTLDATTKAKIVANCDVGEHDLDSAPTGAIVVTVSSPASGVYAKKFSFLMTDRSNTQDFYLTYSSGSSLRIGTAEANTNGASRTLVSYDFGTRLGLAEYVSAKPGGAMSD